MNSTKPEIKKLRIRLYSLDGNIAKHKNKSIFSSISSSLPLKAGNVRLSKYFNPSIVSHLISMPNCWNIFLFRTVLVLIELNVIDPVKFAKRFFSLLNDLWSKFKVTCSLSYAFLHLKRRFKTLIPFWFDLRLSIAIGVLNAPRKQWEKCDCADLI